MNISSTTSFIRSLFFFYLAFDGIVFALMLYQAFASSATRSWPTATGRVLASKVSQKNNDVKYGSTPDVTYAYEIDGKKYKGKTILRGGISSRGRKYSTQVVARYPKDAEVTVYYNPQNPSETCLERYSLVNAPEWKWLATGMLTLPLVAVLVYLRMGR